MIKTKSSLLAIVAVLILSACGIKQSLDDVQNTSVLFVQNIINDNYEQAHSEIDWNRENVSKEQISDYFDVLRYRVQSEFGKDIQYKALGYKQNLIKWSSSPKHTEMLTGKSDVKYSYVQVFDQYHFTIFQLTLDKENKVLSIDMANDVYPIPNSTMFWSIGILLMLIVFSFNVFVLFKVYKSDVTRKWLKYVMVVFLNIPVIGSKLMSGWIFNLLSIQLMGIGFSAQSYLDAYWAIGLPLGAIIVFWRIRNNLYRTTEDDLFYEEAAKMQASNNPD